MPKIAAATVAEHRENVLAALVDASERILRAGDPLTAGVVSSAAGIARNSIYRYVESVDDLRVLVLERYLPGWERAVTTALAPLDDPGDRVVEWVRVNIRQAHLTGHGWFITMAREAPTSAAMQDLAEHAHNIMRHPLGDAGGRNQHLGGQEFQPGIAVRVFRHRGAGGADRGGGAGPGHRDRRSRDPAAGILVTLTQRSHEWHAKVRCLCRRFLESWRP